MTASATIMIVMGILFLGGLYFSNWMIRRNRPVPVVKKEQEELAAEAADPAADDADLETSDAKMVDRGGTPHKFLGVTLLISLLVGVVLTTVLIKGSTTTQVAAKHAHHIYYDKQGRPIIKFRTPPDSDAMSAATTNMDASAITEVRVVISDESLVTTDELLARCKPRQAVIVRNKTVECMDLKQLEKLVNQTLEDHKISPDPMVKPKGKSRPRPLMQSILAVVESPTVTTTTKEVARPWWDRYAEVFYFLALVMGILSKFYWDYSAERAATNKEVPFDVHIIAMSFIVACLVYYSIQQGLEKEASKLSIRGALFAFNNGFMWQVILKDIQRRPPPARTQRKSRAAVTP